MQIFKDNITTGELNADYSVARLMSCFFSPALHEDLELPDEPGVSQEHLKQLGLGSAAPSKPSKLKHMTLEQLQAELKAQEAAFKSYFLAEKKKNQSFSLKDVTDADMAATLRSIHEIKRYISLRQDQAKNRP